MTRITNNYNKLKSAFIKYYVLIFKEEIRMSHKIANACVFCGAAAISLITLAVIAILIWTQLT